MAYLPDPSDTRYPYTYACDFIKCLVGHGERGAKLSRADASQIRQGIASALDTTDVDLAIVLADHYLINQDAIEERCLHSVLDAIGDKTLTNNS